MVMLNSMKTVWSGLLLYYASLQVCSLRRPERGLAIVPLAVVSHEWADALRSSHTQLAST